jgi:hypothetical protein
MFLNVPQGNVEEKMVEMFVGIWTLLMPSPQVAFVGTRKTAGVKRQSKLLTAPKIWRVHVWS